MKKCVQQKNRAFLSSLPQIFLVFAAVSILNGRTANAEPEYNSFGRRDPFVPLVGVSAGGTKSGLLGILSIDDVDLQGIVVDPGGDEAVIINGDIIKKGETVGRVYIEEVDENAVVIFIDEERFEKKLYER